MHRQDGRQEIDRRTLLARGAAFAALLVTGCARKESRGFAAMSLGQLRARAHPSFPLRGFVRCQCCGRRLTGCWSKGGSITSPEVPFREGPAGA